MKSNDCAHNRVIWSGIFRYNNKYCADIKVEVMSKDPVFFKSPEMAKKFPLHPKHPERTCWGCDKYCSVNSLQCGNGSGRTQHPAEMLGDDWYKWGDWGNDSAETPVMSS